MVALTTWGIYNVYIKGYFMQTQVKTWGNSQGIRIPKEILQEAEVSDLEIGSTYTFKIRAVKTLGSKTVYSPYSTEKTIRAYEVSADGLPESEHPYGINMNQSWTYSIVHGNITIVGL